MIIDGDDLFAIGAKTEIVASFDLAYYFVGDIIKHLYLSIVVAGYNLQHFWVGVPLDSSNWCGMLVMMSFFEGFNCKDLNYLASEADCQVFAIFGIGYIIGEQFVV